MQCRKKIGIHEAEHLLSNLFFTLYLQCNNLKLLFGARPKAEHQLITEGVGHQLFVGGRNPPPKCYLH